jgi:uncharacterized protein (TIRG00374 family)
VHLLALAAWLLSLAGRGGRITLLAKGLGRGISLRAAMATQLTGEAAAAVTPSRSGSDPARLVALKRLGVDLPTGMVVLVGEMVAEGIVLLAVVAALVVILPAGRLPVLGALPYAAAALALPFAAVLLARLPARRTPPRLLMAFGLRTNTWRGIRSGARRFRRKTRALLRLDALTVVGILLVSLVHVVARLAILPILALGLTPGLPLGPLVVWPLLLLYTGSLLPPPGGGGGVELAFAAALTTLLGGPTLAAVLFWWRVYTFYLGALVGAGVLFLTYGRMGLSTVSPGQEAAPLPGESAPLPSGR